VTTIVRPDGPVAWDTVSHDWLETASHVSWFVVTSTSVDAADAGAFHDVSDRLTDALGPAAWVTVTTVVAPPAVNVI
jgi:hypothetical protein